MSKHIFVLLLILFALTLVSAEALTTSSDSSDLPKDQRSGRFLGRYYGSSTKGAMTSLLPTSPSRSSSIGNYYTDVEYGYRTTERNSRPTMNEMMNYLQMYETGSGGGGNSMDGGGDTSPMMDMLTAATGYGHGHGHGMGRLRAGGAKGPGTLFILPCVDSCYVLDLRTVTFDVPPQEILTHDAVTVAVDAVVYYRVYNPTIAVANVEDYNSKGCNSALGLLGVLGLAAYLQSVLQQMQNATGRRRRDIEPIEEQRIEMTDHEMNAFFNSTTDEDDNEFESEEQQDNSFILKQIFPALSAIGHARDGLIPVNCTYRQICSVNKMLVNYFGDGGRSAAALLSVEMGQMLLRADRRRGPITLKTVNKVAQLGRNGHDCRKLFQDCQLLSILPSYTMPSGSLQGFPEHLQRHFDTIELSSSPPASRL